MACKYEQHLELCAKQLGVATGMVKYRGIGLLEVSAAIAVLTDERDRLLGKLNYQKRKVRILNRKEPTHA